MIQFLGVSKIYPSSPDPIKALDNVSFEISDGEFVFLVGPSGSGKTTILKQIIREELPSDGRIYFEDQDITKMSRTQVYQLRRKIGVVFQDYKLIEEKNIYENVAFAMEAASFSHKEIAETVPYVLDIVNLSDRAASFPKQLSGGEKQKVAIARAIANNPKVFIADEPTGNLDPKSAWDIVQILSKINKWGTTIIMSTHGTEIVNTLQKRVLKLENGKLLRDDKKGSYEGHSSTTVKIKIKKKVEELESEEKPAEENTEIIDEKVTKGTKEETKSEEIIPPEISIPDKKVEKDIANIEEKLAIADQSEISALKLSKNLEDKLSELGYKDVEDILTAGIAKVNESINKTQAKQLAKAIKRFLTME